jgi:hypothetical protein
LRSRWLGGAAGHQVQEDTHVSCKVGAAFHLFVFVGVFVQHAVEVALDSADTWAAKAGLKAKQARSAVRFLLLVFIGAAKLAVGSVGLRDDLERLGM